MVYLRTEFRNERNRIKDRWREGGQYVVSQEETCIR